MTQLKPTTIITGATRGLGRAMAEKMAQSGERVITLGRRSVPELVELAKVHSTDWNELLVDLSDRTETEQAGKALATLLEGVEQASLILNAGTVNPILPADHHSDLGAIAQAFDINIIAPIYLTGCFLQATTGASDRRIMMISSGAGRNASHSWGIYCATKAAMDRYVEAVKIEGHANLRIASVAPGIVDTPMQETIRGTSEELFPNRKKFEDFHRTGALADPKVTASNLLSLLAKADFGDRAIDDVRQHTF